MVLSLIPAQKLKTLNLLIRLNPNQATTKLPLPAGATGFFSDFAPLIATCNPLVFVGQAAPSNDCYLGIAAQNPLLGALVLYTPTDAGYLFKSFGPLCTVPFFGLDSTTLPCPLTDGVEAGFIRKLTSDGC